MHTFESEVTIRSDHAEARQVQNEIERHLVRCAFDEHDIFGIRLALEEALINAIKHGNQSDPSKKVRVCYRVQVDHFHVQIADEGDGFNPNDLPDPTLPENLERPSGRGVMLMRHFMNEVRYNDRGNFVSMTKRRNGKK